MAASGVGTASTVTFGTSSWTPEVTNVSWSPSRPDIDITDLTTANARTYIVGAKYDPGELVLELIVDTSEEVPFAAVKEEITVKFQGSATKQWVCDGFMTGFEMDIPLEDKMTATATFKMSGTIAETLS